MTNIKLAQFYVKQINNLLQNPMSQQNTLTLLQKAFEKISFPMKVKCYKRKIDEVSHVVDNTTNSKSICVNTKNLDLQKMLNSMQKQIQQLQNMLSIQNKNLLPEINSNDTKISESSVTQNLLPEIKSNDTKISESSVTQNLLPEINSNDTKISESSVTQNLLPEINSNDVNEDLMLQIKCIDDISNFPIKLNGKSIKYDFRSMVKCKHNICGVEIIHHKYNYVLRSAGNKVTIIYNYNGTVYHITINSYTQSFKLKNEVKKVKLSTNQNNFIQFLDLKVKVATNTFCVLCDDKCVVNCKKLEIYNLFDDVCYQAKYSYVSSFISDNLRFKVTYTNPDTFNVCYENQFKSYKLEYNIENNNLIPLAFNFEKKCTLLYAIYWNYYKKEVYLTFIKNNQNVNKTLLMNNSCIKISHYTITNIQELVKIIENKYHYIYDSITNE